MSEQVGLVDVGFVGHEGLAVSLLENQLELDHEKALEEKWLAGNGIYEMSYLVD